jgi:hypothetical protein
MLVAIALFVSQFPPEKPLKSITGIVVPRPNATSVLFNLSNRVFNDRFTPTAIKQLTSCQTRFAERLTKDEGLRNQAERLAKIVSNKKPDPSLPSEYSIRRRRAIKKANYQKQ